MFQHHDQGSMLEQNNAKSHWWARSGPQGDGPHIQESFVEPPDINYHTWNKDENNYQDDYSERSVDQEEGLEWRIPRRLERTTFGDEVIEGGDVSLHFDDVYSRPPGTPPPDLDGLLFKLWNDGETR
ncbi:hypothetical protein MLD38_031859 [Melastoma candidum]|nr:hypothetical protein MLD38_031859 [Melastoma candidum]